MTTFHADVQRDIQLRVLNCDGDVVINGHDQSTIDITGDEPFERYLRQDGATITIDKYPADLKIHLPYQASVELNGISGDVQVGAVGDLGTASMAKLNVHHIGGDVRVSNVGQIELESIGGDARIQQSGSADNAMVTIGEIGGDLEVGRAAQLSVKTVGGDARIQQVERLVKLKHVGGDLKLTLNGGTEGHVRSIIGGDVELRIPQDADLTLEVSSGGELNGSGHEWNVQQGSGRQRLVFGEGRSQLRLMAGGDVTIQGGTAPQQSTGFAGHQGEGSGDWRDICDTIEGFGQEMRGFTRELEELGRNLARDLSGLGRDIARDVRVAGRETLRDAVRGYKPGRNAGWRRGAPGDFGFDPEQIERLKREARSAAASGIARAQEAVEQALQQWQQGQSSGRPAPPRSPAAPTPPPAPGSYTGQTIRIEREEPSSAPAQTSTSQSANRDAERLAILRMVHEGRISPDEAELLLRGLNERS
jgi:hypothetical protein